MKPRGNLSQLQWVAPFVESFPGDPEKSGRTRKVKDAAYSEIIPTPVSDPHLVAWSEDLAAELGIADGFSSDKEALSVLSGNQVLPGMRPFAARYGGHQFGSWAGQLGDGRAISLGEVCLESKRLELQLKGAGPTPYSRRGDGRAVLRSSIREFLCSEAMYSLGVPTTRALSLVTTGERVIRDLFYDGNPQEEPGAIVCRVSPTFLRFGNFEIFAASGEFELLQHLEAYTRREYFPNLKNPAELLDEVGRRTALLMVEWARVGFVHGVMNTDNMSILGLTIDYGPYGWLEPYDPNWTPNTTDAQHGRYRFGNQPAIGQWNFMRLCEAFYPLVKSEERLHESVALYERTFETAHSKMLAQKLGISSLDSPVAQKLTSNLFKLLSRAETDYTLFFRAICDWDISLDSNTTDGQRFLSLIKPAFYTEGVLAEAPDLAQSWIEWSKDYSHCLRADSLDASNRKRMKFVNPKYVLRNYLAQNAIHAAENGDFSVLERLKKVLKSPYDEQTGEDDLAAKRPEWARHSPGCSTLSCSS